jgi:hypothetical protein
MAIRALSRQEFDRFTSAQPSVAGFTSEAVEWLADDTGLVLGAVAHHKSDLNWAFVVLSRDRQGQFRPLYLQFGAWNIDEAHGLLLASMEAALATGELELAPPPHKGERNTPICGRRTASLATGCGY